jgi:hypothetical protein
VSYLDDLKKEYGAGIFGAAPVSSSEFTKVSHPGAEPLYADTLSPEDLAAITGGGEFSESDRKERPGDIGKFLKDAKSEAEVRRAWEDWADYGTPTDGSSDTIVVDPDTGVDILYDGSTPVLDMIGPGASGSKMSAKAPAPAPSPWASNIGEVHYFGTPAGIKANEEGRANGLDIHTYNHQKSMGTWRIKANGYWGTPDARDFALYAQLGVGGMTPEQEALGADWTAKDTAAREGRAATALEAKQEYQRKKDAADALREGRYEELRRTAEAKRQATAEKLRLHELQPEVIARKAKAAEKEAARVTAWEAEQAENKWRRENPEAWEAEIAAEREQRVEEARLASIERAKERAKEPKAFDIDAWLEEYQASQAAEKYAATKAREKAALEAIIDPTWAESEKTPDIRTYTGDDDPPHSGLGGIYPATAAEEWMSRRATPLTAGGETAEAGAARDAAAAALGFAAPTTAEITGAPHHPDREIPGVATPSLLAESGVIDAAKHAIAAGMIGKSAMDALESFSRDDDPMDRMTHATADKMKRDAEAAGRAVSRADILKMIEGDVDYKIREAALAPTATAGEMTAGTTYPMMYTPKGIVEDMGLTPVDPISKRPDFRAAVTMPPLSGALGYSKPIPSAGTLPTPPFIATESMVDPTFVPDASMHYSDPLKHYDTETVSSHLPLSLTTPFMTALEGMEHAAEFAPPEWEYTPVMPPPSAYSYPGFTPSSPYGSAPYSPTGYSPITGTVDPTHEEIMAVLGEGLPGMSGLDPFGAPLLPSPLMMS